MDNRPIGVFDSGLGGLTGVRELRKRLPHEEIIYFGDTGRVPYGSRGREIIRKYAKQDMNFLIRHDVKAVLAACGTVSSVARDIGDALPVPYFDVLRPTARAAVSKRKTQDRHYRHRRHHRSAPTARRSSVSRRKPKCSSRRAPYSCRS